MVFSALALAACASAELVGADAVSAGHEPPARRVASFRSVDSKNGAGGHFEHVLRVFLVSDGETPEFLVVARPSQDSLVVRKSRVEGKERVFQFVIDPGDAPALLADYRIPADGADGRMAVAHRFTRSEVEPGLVSARVTEVDFACRLARETGVEEAAQ